MTLIDTHAHLSYEDLQVDFGGVLDRARQVGVSAMIAVATDLASTRMCVELASQHSQIYASAGIHPNHLLAATADQWPEILELGKHPRVVAWGETGLDRYWKDVPFELQIIWFQMHMKASRELGKPVIIHTRDCDADIIEQLELAAQRGPLSGVMHSFTGTWETAQRCLDLGLYISFAGMLTFKKSQTLRELAARVPDDRILVETDSPYLSPEPFRGKYPNEPSRVVHTAAAIAAARQQDFDKFQQLSTDNARRLFGLG